MTSDTECTKCPDGQADFAGMCLPRVDFITFVYSMASTAMVHLGEMPDPSSGQTLQDVPLAKHTIDTLGMLEEKTKGNLSEEENRQLKDILGHLRMLFVKKHG